MLNCSAVVAVLFAVFVGPSCRTPLQSHHANVESIAAPSQLIPQDVSSSLQVMREKSNHLGTVLAESIMSQNRNWWPIAEDLTQRREELLRYIAVLEDSLLVNQRDAILENLRKIEAQAQYVGGRLLAYANDLGVEPVAKNDMVVSSQAILAAKQAIFDSIFVAR